MRLIGWIGFALCLVQLLVLPKLTYKPFSYIPELSAVGIGDWIGSIVGTYFFASIGIILVLIGIRRKKNLRHDVNRVPNDDLDNMLRGEEDKLRNDNEAEEISFKDLSDSDRGK